MPSTQKRQFESVLLSSSKIKLVGFGIFVFGWLVCSDPSESFAQTPVSQNRSLVAGLTDSQQASQTSVAAQSQIRALHSKVRIVVEQNRILVIGSKEDVKTVAVAIEIIREKMLANSDSTVSERVVLKFQLAETVTTIMSNMMGMHSRGAPVKISPLHFPEAVLIVGPASSVRNAKKLLAAIDSHDGFPIPSEPTVSKPARVID